MSIRNETTTLIQIVIRLPPAVCGVGDYAAHLATSLRDLYQVNTRFITIDPLLHPTENRFDATVLKERNSQALLTALNEISNSIKGAPPPVLLQLSPYGYEKNGCPFWLLQGLAAWKAQDSRNRLMTMFHEVYATGAPWRKAFWLSPFQKQIARQIAHLSDEVFTSTQTYADTLLDTKDSKIRNIMPVFSNIGEPGIIPTLAQRSKRLIIFGQAPNRMRIYKSSLAVLDKLCSQLDITEICDIGPEIETPGIDGASFIKKGILPATEISRLMLDSRIGFFNYPDRYLAKSGVFAAYCAHGLAPVCAGFHSEEIDGIKASTQFIAINHSFEFLDQGRLQSIADAAHAWYAPHSIQQQAKRFFACLNKP